MMMTRMIKLVIMIMMIGDDVDYDDDYDYYDDDY